MVSKTIPHPYVGVKEDVESAFGVKAPAHTESFDLAKLEETELVTEVRGRCGASSTPA